MNYIKDLTLKNPIEDVTDDHPFTPEQKHALVNTELGDHAIDAVGGQDLNHEQRSFVKEAVAKDPHFGAKRFGMLVANILGATGDILSNKVGRTQPIFDEGYARLAHNEKEGYAGSDLSKSYQNQILSHFGDQLNTDEKKRVTNMSYDDLTKIFGGMKPNDDGIDKGLITQADLDTISAMGQDVSRYKVGDPFSHLNAVATLGLNTTKNEQGVRDNFADYLTKTGSPYVAHKGAVDAVSKWNEAGNIKDPEEKKRALQAILPIIQKSILPNESVMSDDTARLLSSSAGNSWTDKVQNLFNVATTGDIVNEQAFNTFDKLLRIAEKKLRDQADDQLKQAKKIYRVKDDVSSQFEIKNPLPTKATVKQDGNTVYYSGDDLQLLLKHKDDKPWLKSHGIDPTSIEVE
jgi:hypothetical protein